MHLLIKPVVPASTLLARSYHLLKSSVYFHFFTTNNMKPTIASINVTFLLIILVNLGIIFIQPVIGEVANNHRPRTYQSIQPARNKNRHKSRILDRVEEAKENLISCLSPLLNMTELREAIRNYNDDGSQDEVFHRYCSRMPQLWTCLKYYASTLETLLDEKDKENSHIVQNIFHSLLKFVCYQDGDGLALFLGTGGLQCIQSKVEQIKSCVQEKLNEYRLSGSDSLTEDIDSSSNQNRYTSDFDGKFGSNLRMKLIEGKECKLFGALEKCVVTPLNQCEKPTPAKFVQSFYNTLNEASPCHHELAPQSEVLE